MARASDDRRSNPVAAIGEMMGAAAKMSTDEAMRLITYCEIGRSPAVPLWALMARRDEVADRLLGEIAHSASEIERRLGDAPDERHAYFLHSFAVYLLAHWEETRAFRPLVAYLAADSMAAMEQLGDTVTEDLHAILARCYDGGDLSPMKVIIEDNGADAYVRDACLKALHAMSRLGKVPRQEVVAYYAEVAEKLRDPINEDWSDCFVLTLAGLQEPSLRPAIDAWFDAGLIDDLFVSKADIDRTYREIAPVLDEELLQAARFDGLVEYLSEWAWFTSDDPEDFDLPDYAGLTDDEALKDDPLVPWRDRQEPFVRATPKVGRNDPCPCGSGKKHKKCCLDADGG